MKKARPTGYHSHPFSKTSSSPLDNIWNKNFTKVGQDKTEEVRK